ncbi:hypothetical protein Godav_029481 [Gossypium davidsonii]|uniref:Uncharacterized protein n=1 Tax=Gossypium davidsonii TaxID=34287 RepID=A0A7J8TH48_GOSDV|nr:hypothetical protein [Gossypium davidsonii]
MMYVLKRLTSLLPLCRKKKISFLYIFPSSIATAGFTQSIGSYRYPFNTTYVVKRILETHQSTKARIFQKIDSYSKSA